MSRAISVALGRIVRGETALHRRVRREALLALAVVSAVEIYRFL